jgi:hypothetical protein
MDAAIQAKLDDVLARLRAADWKQRDAVKAELLALVSGHPPAMHAGLREHLENAKKEMTLEVRWEVDEVIEAITPPPAPKKEEPKPEKKGLSQSDLNLVYDDPRGLMLYKTKKPPERWFATQVDPRTGQPQMFELQPAEITQLKTQLHGSPYWLLGSGEGTK